MNCRGQPRPHRSTRFRYQAFHWDVDVIFELLIMPERQQQQAVDGQGHLCIPCTTQLTFILGMIVPTPGQQRLQKHTVFLHLLLKSPHGLAGKLSVWNSSMQSVQKCKFSNVPIQATSSLPFNPDQQPFFKAFCCRTSKRSSRSSQDGKVRPCRPADVHPHVP